MIKSPGDAYFRPGRGRLGDVIPFGHGDEFHVFFLDYRPERFDSVPASARRTSWGHLISRDLLSWERVADAIAPSADGVDAASCATGSVIGADGVFHLYYTGRHFTPAGDRREVICEATSTDLEHWHKRDNNPVLTPDPRSDELDAFRDPHVFKDPTTGEYTMLITATRLGGPPRRSGALARARSRDLEHWHRDGYFWAPGISQALECADFFSIGDWYYLLFSTEARTHYRKSRNPDGPWLEPTDDVFDVHGFYAGKTAAVGARRVLFGWLADVLPERDDGGRVWGGSLITRRLTQRHDGALVVSPSVRPMSGAASEDVTGSSVDARTGFAFTSLPSGRDPALDILMSVPERGRYGLIVRSDARLTTGYCISFDVGAQTMSWSAITVRGEETTLRRSCHLTPGAQMPLQVTLAGSVVDVIAADASMCTRAFDSPGDLNYVWAEGADLHFGAIRNDAGAQPLHPLVANAVDDRTVGTTDSAG